MRWSCSPTCCPLVLLRLHSDMGDAKKTCSGRRLLYRSCRRTTVNVFSAFSNVIRKEVDALQYSMPSGPHSQLRKNDFQREMAQSIASNSVRGGKATIFS
ncbi:unnamed protein product [Caenorhabditis auriculariae]|uniref:Uncharacterized protein n=1 Tax=Caenorhabditis auriculariae TaxID=2777116 RepID=A0A8S1HBT3_9PELO|nr:unnamed protein product [Caenorhabditis auriculariae]